MTTLSENIRKAVTARQSGIEAALSVNSVHATLERNRTTLEISIHYQCLGFDEMGDILPGVAMQAASTPPDSSISVPVSTPLSADRTQACAVGHPQGGLILGTAG